MLLLDKSAAAHAFRGIKIFTKPDPTNTTATTIRNVARNLFVLLARPTNFAFMVIIITEMWFWCNRECYSDTAVRFFLLVENDVSAIATV
jgi:hypothetical protein